MEGPESSFAHGIPTTHQKTAPSLCVALYTFSPTVLGQKNQGLTHPLGKSNAHSAPTVDCPAGCHPASQ